MLYLPKFIRSVEECGDDDTVSVYHSRGDVAGSVKDFATVEDVVLANQTLKLRKATYRWYAV